MKKIILFKKKKIFLFYLLIVEYFFLLGKVLITNTSPHKNFKSLTVNYINSFFYNFIYSFKNILRPQKLNFSIKKTGSKYWDNCNEHIRFVIKYYSLRHYLCSPVIKIVCSSNHHKVKLSKNFIKKNSFFKNFANIIYKKFVNTNFNAIIRSLSLYKYIFNLPFIKKKLSQNISCLEIGPGLGFNSFYYSCLNSKPIYFFDTPEMNFLQKKIYNYLAKSIKLNKIYFETDVKNLEKKIKQKKYYIFAFWSFSEFSHLNRVKFHQLIKKSLFSVFIFNEFFEQVNNQKYFIELASIINKKIKFLPLKYDKNTKKHKICIVY
jgi:hypothetical protein